MKRLAVVALALCLAGTAASARAAVAPAKLALMPLSQSMLAGKAAGMRLSQDSGVVTNAEAAEDANGQVKTATVVKLGRLTGYELEYGNGPAGSSLNGLSTGVELYRSPAAAARGLAFWRKDELDTSFAEKLRFEITSKPISMRGLGAGSYGYAGTVKLQSGLQLAFADVAFRVGAVVGYVSVSGRDTAKLPALALANARSLRARIAGVLAGRITGPAPPRPLELKPGPPPNGPDLAKLAIGPGDLGPSKVTGQRYVVDRDLEPISEYERTMEPAGPFLNMQQTVTYVSDPIEASFQFQIFRGVFTSKKDMKDAGIKPSTLRVVKTKAGDESFAIVGVIDASGTPVSIGYVVVRVGQTLQLVVVSSLASNPIPDDVLAGLANLAAERARNALHPPGVA